MPNASTVAELAVVVTADTSAAERGLSDLGTKVGNAGSALQTAFAGAAVAGIAGVAAGLSASVVAATDFEKTMSAVKAVSGATADEMGSLSGLALQLGKDTSFSASEAGKGIEELVKGGLSIPDIMNGAAKATLDLAAAGGVSLPDAATIAANALAEFNLKGSDMAHVADLIAGAANASAIDVSDFKFSMSAAGSVAAAFGFTIDDLAQGIAVMGKAGITGSDAGTSLKTMMLNLSPSTNKAADQMRDLGIITGQTGPVMDKLRASLGETALGQKKLAELTKSGLINSEEELFKALDKVNPALSMGASNATDYGVKTGLLGNQFFDATGKVKGMADIAQVLQTATKDLTKEQQINALQTIFGSDAIRAATVFVKEGSAGFNEMADSMSKVTAQAVGAEKLNNLAGSVEQLKGSLETMAIMIGIQLLPILKDFVDAVTQAANDAMPSMEQAAKDVAATLKEWIPTLKLVAGFLWENRDAIAAVATALATFVILTTVVGWITTLVTAVTAVTAAISASGGVVAALGALVAILGGPVTLVIAAVALAVGLLSLAWTDDWGGIREVTADVVDWLGSVPGTIEGYWEAISGATDDLIHAVTDGWRDLIRATSDAWAAVRRATETAWNAVADFLTAWWREILVALTGPVGLVAVLIIDHWEQIKAATETVFKAITNILIAVWDLIYNEIIKPKLDAISSYVATTWETIRSTVAEKVGAAQTFLATTWEAIRSTVTEEIGAVQTFLATTWDAIKSKATEVLGSLLAYVRDTIFEPLRAAIVERVSAAQEAAGGVWTAISTKAHEVLDPLLTYVRDTVFQPMKAAAESAMSGVQSAFSSAVDGVKSTVENGMETVRSAWATVWTAIENAAKSPQDALNELKKLIEGIVKVMPDWLIPHSPTPFQKGLEGVMGAVKAMGDHWIALGSAVKGANGEIGSYITEAARARGIDPTPALKVAEHEGGLDEYNKLGDFSGPPWYSGKSWWPYQLHYGGKGYEAWGHTAGMGNAFTRETGWAPGDPRAWKPSIDYALDAAAQYGWGAWYGRKPAGVGEWEGIPGHAAGGWAGLHGPELGWLGERGPEYIVPHAALASAGVTSGATQHITLDVAIGGAVAERIYVTGRDLAVRRGRGTTGVGTPGGPLVLGGIG